MFVKHVILPRTPEDTAYRKAHKRLAALTWEQLDRLEEPKAYFSGLTERIALTYRKAQEAHAKESGE